jgi:hypothetical protein
VQDNENTGVQVETVEEEAVKRKGQKCHESEQEECHHPILQLAQVEE